MWTVDDFSAIPETVTPAEGAFTGWGLMVTLGAAGTSESLVAVLVPATEGLPAASKATTLAVRVPLDSDDTSKVCETTWLPLGATPATDSAVVAPSASS